MLRVCDTSMSAPTQDERFQFCSDISILFEIRPAFCEYVGITVFMHVKQLILEISNVYTALSNI